MHFKNHSAESHSKSEVLDYNPSRLLDAMIDILRIKNDAALARTLKVSAPNLSKIRHGRIGLSPGVLIKMNEVSGVSIQQLKYLLGSK